MFPEPKPTIRIEDGHHIVNMDPPRGFDTNTIEISLDGGETYFPVKTDEIGSVEIESI